jgi:cellulose synthase/poly-beta-1,6-N-acetylglucosamine synthase-like glycosyltransferase
MLFYVYLGYPGIVFLLAIIKNRNVKKGNYEPYVTILVAAYNEEAGIEDTLKNKLTLNYPKKKLEIIVISDGSTDKTDEIVKQYKEQGVKFLRQEPRAGKTAALKMALPKAKGEILIFSDANSIYEQDAVRKLMQNFNDPTVGYVTGKMIYDNLNGTPVGDGCTSYMKYENLLRQFETKIGSVVGVDGGIDAVRKDLYQPMNPDQLPDFVLPLKVLEQGYRIVYEPEAILKESSLKSSKDEYKMRVRVSLRALWALWDMRHLIAIKAPRLFAWELFSHKWLRYLSFIFLICLYISNLYLWNQGLYFKILFLLQNIFYISAPCSLILENRGQRSRILYLPYYFTLINLASAHAFIKFLLGKKQVIWTPRKG